MHSINFIVFKVTCLMSIVTTWLAAYRYGINITPNVLEILPASNFLYFAIMLVTLQLCLSNAVGSSALFQQVEDYFNIPKGKGYLEIKTKQQHVYLNVFFFSLKHST